MASPQTHRREEWNGRRTLHGVHSDEPVKRLREHSIALLAELRQDGVESALSGLCLMPAIEQADEPVTDLGNQVTMQPNLHHVVGVGNLGVTARPIATFQDRGVHLGFDLTHGWVPLFELQTQ